ncbi:hypothetical protein ABTY98_11935 [Streptomyces sp. NPDC096040]|uniref:hypothetical protein n=1 Tax=Streptomyces sp. NPDC096040 TaxID=3155541 RepID=UPI00333062CC
MDYVKMRAIAEELDAFAERLEGAWSVEIGPSGPVLDPCKGRCIRKDPYIYGDSVPFGPWTVETSAFRRYGKAGD